MEIRKARQGCKATTRGCDLWAREFKADILTTSHTVFVNEYPLDAYRKAMWKLWNELSEETRKDWEKQGEAHRAKVRGDLRGFVPPVLPQRSAALTLSSR